MKANLGVPEVLQESVGAFVKDQGIELGIAAEGAVSVQVAPEGERPKSDEHVLHSGGWIPCETAFAVAKKLQISLPQTGKLLDHLDVKVRECGLGCF